jgi:putative glutamine amidotransferase
MKYTSVILLLLFTLHLHGQNFFREEFDQNKTYILLANPTAANIETVQFLMAQNLLNINLKKTEFVGVYFEKQKYDFSVTEAFIRNEGIKHIHLHEVRGDLEENQLFRQNHLTDELRMLFQHSSGIFFFGGPDIPPSVYGEENLWSVVTDPERHYFEVTFLFHLLGGFTNDTFEPFLEKKPDYFVTGFCLGMQTMNVATGGTLIQDIPAQVYGAETPEETIKTGRENMHRNYWHLISEDRQLVGINFHTIRFTDHPFFGKRVKVRKDNRPLIYSSHHQAAGKTGKGLEVTALSADGKIVEGIVHHHYPHVFAVQFHPEVPSLYKSSELHKIFPDDIPQTYPRIIGKEGRKFHKSYWRYISKTLEKASGN